MPRDTNAGPAPLNAEELYRAGRLKEAIASLNSHLRDNPGDSRSRTFLFELLCFAGDYPRAGKQLDVLEQQGNQASVIATLVYRAALNAEKIRQQMFETKTYPAPVVETATRAVGGKLNGKEFESLSDADGRIGQKLEIFAAGDYMWISYRDIASLAIEPPKRLRDLLWIPAQLQTGPTFRSRDLGQVLLPAISPLSWRHADDQVRLGRISEWVENESEEIAPFGQKLLLADGEEIPFLEIRELVIDPQ